MATAPAPIPAPTRRVIFTQGGKGGVGKTMFMTGLAEWFEDRNIAYSLFDLDTENKLRGSITPYFRNKAKKVNIHVAGGLDSLLPSGDQDAPIVLADLGAGSGQIVHRWFQSMKQGSRPDVAFTAVGVLTPDPASVESVLSWASVLQRRVEYLIVKNALSYPADFSFWDQGIPAERFRQACAPAEIEMEYRVPQFESLIRQFGATIGQAASRKLDIPELQQFTVVVRAQAYRRHLYAELDRVKGLLTL